ncbi:hypothetical protein CAI21_13370 [Alkalilimnicola ehrlichii]|uniref:L,D-TPase catalytic domain-containing protein n=1 Tax=Alkalilimnicola ehrlichii TaxID=351052 RepID=A0A3E0WPI4_9GAMM|nr:L,D-transpeptidase family protein [Alkalilimnicola ehrlichii]RFA28299.1 hypothetical protein CAI21_13370 [Alkalilimnicola ehrlichii]RFA34900.1 hypothetical protein CAL65_14505 [Alkalilimnicola ehrlichii]
MQKFMVSLVLGWFAQLASAATYPLPPEGESLIGEIRYVEVQEGETLLDIGRRNGLGYLEMHRANPGIDMWVPEPGTIVTLPTMHILPDVPRQGLVLNVAEMRLYYFPKPSNGDEAVVETYPVSVGQMDWSTPLGETQVTLKLENPAWYPPASVRQVAAERGEELPRVVPPGPNNPIGAYAMRLDIPGYFIHGTNEPWRVGMRVTHGCIRMYPEDIEQLFYRVPVGTSVRIVNEPFKAAWREGTLYLQAHRPLEEDRQAIARDARHAYMPALDVVANALTGNGDHRVDYYRIRYVLEQKLGIPMPISRAGMGEGAQLAQQ